MLTVSLPWCWVASLLWLAGRFFLRLTVLLLGILLNLADFVVLPGSEGPDGFILVRGAAISGDVYLLAGLLVAGDGEALALRL